MKRIKLFSAVAVLLLTTACSTTPHFDQLGGSVLDKEHRISLKDSKIFLANGGDGMKKTMISLESDEISEGSGLSALTIANNIMAKSAPLLVAENKPLTEDKAVEIGQLNKSDYVIFSHVEKWTDPLGINCHEKYSDEASVVLSIYSVEEKQLINSTRLWARSCPFTLNGIPLSTGSPESLYEDMFTLWLDKNFQK